MLASLGVLLGHAPGVPHISRYNTSYTPIYPNIVPNVPQHNSQYALRLRPIHVKVTPNRPQYCTPIYPKIVSNVPQNHGQAFDHEIKCAESLTESPRLSHIGVQAPIKHDDTYLCLFNT